MGILQIFIEKFRLCVISEKTETLPNDYVVYPIYLCNRCRLFSP